MKNINKRKLSILAVLIVGALFIWLIYHRIISGSKKGLSRSGAVVAVEVEAVRRGPVRDVGLFTGSLLPKSQFVVAPKVNGWLKKLLVDVGDTVQRDQVIAILDDDEFTQDVEQARAELEVAKANMENHTSDLAIAEREFKRAKTLREKQIASESELDEAEAEFNASEARLKVSQALVMQREAALKTTQLRLSYTKIRAWWEEVDEIRVVGERFVDEGALLKANEPIVSILENSILTGVIHVIERDYPKISIAQKALITTDAYPDKTFTGQVVRIAPMLKESSRQARVEVKIPNPDGFLKPGMFIRVQIEFARHEDVTIIPAVALVGRNDQQGIFLADLDALKVRFVAVTVGVVNAKEAEIIQPQLSGNVVTLGHHLLEDGSAITLPGRSEPGDDQ
ncbi:MAG: efflux RND transporter periplasmic adaptor subunit [Planctomycetota bacterium]|jgi:RND family efflux transporter MFP subunit